MRLDISLEDDSHEMQNLPFSEKHKKKNNLLSSASDVISALREYSQASCCSFLS